MATLETQQLDQVIATSRRKMLTLGGAALAGLALASVAEAQSTTLGDADYLNFALNLEYLEAQFYTLAVSGATIDTMGVGLTGTGTQGIVVTKSGGPSACKVPFANTAVSNYAAEIATEERNHVNFLRSALMTSAVAMPQIDLVNSFNTLATAAGLGSTFDPFANDVNFLVGSYIFEDVGVTAYTGAAPLLQNAAYLDAAAGIQAVEAYHAGLIRTVIYGLDQSSATPGAYLAITQAVSKLRATVDGSNLISAARLDGDDIGLGMQQVMLNGTSNVTASTIVNCTTTGSINAANTGTTTANSQVFARTAAQVLPVVYAGGTTTNNKGFFPAGLNGNVK